MNLLDYLKEEKYEIRDFTEEINESNNLKCYSFGSYDIKKNGHYYSEYAVVNVFACLVEFEYTTSKGKGTRKKAQKIFLTTHSEKMINSKNPTLGGLEYNEYIYRWIDHQNKKTLRYKNPKIISTKDIINFDFDLRYDFEKGKINHSFKQVLIRNILESNWVLNREQLVAMVTKMDYRDFVLDNDLMSYNVYSVKVEYLTSRSNRTKNKMYFISNQTVSSDKITDLVLGELDFLNQHYPHMIKNDIKILDCNHFIVNATY